MRYEALIFDMDGTVLDTESISRAGWKQATESLGYQLDDHVIGRMLGHRFEHWSKIIIAALGEAFPLAKARELRDQYYDSFIQEKIVGVKAGIKELLDHLDARSVPRAIATSNRRELASFLLGKAGIEKRFHALVGGNEVTHAKPEPDLYIAASKKINVTPEKILVIEDSGPGIRAAAAAGMDVVLVRDHAAVEADVSKLCVQSFDTAHEVIRFIQER